MRPLRLWRDRICVGLLLVLWGGLTVPVWAEATFSSQYDPATHKAVLTLTDVLPAYRVQAQGPWVLVDWTGPQPNHMKLTDSDQPELPYLLYWISVPENTRVLSVSLKPEREPLPLSAPVVPVRRPYIPGPGVAEPPLQASAPIYTSSAEYPTEDYTYTLVGKGSARILELKVYACKYVGAERKLLLYRAPKLKVELDVPHWTPSPEPKNVMDTEIQRKLVNPEEAFFGLPLRP